jgi:transcriptional regulator with XRE-family HTH domain
MKHPPPQAFGPTVNRVSDVAAHTTRYAFKGVGRLARDAGISPSAVSRLVSGKMNPSFVLVARITEALEKELGYRIDPRDLVAERGRFLTRFTCDLVANCRGCIPEAATDEFGDTKKAFEGVRPGQWVTSRYPMGYEVTEQEGGDVEN